MPGISTSKGYKSPTTRAYLARVPDFSIDLAVTLPMRAGYPEQISGFALDKSIYYAKDEEVS